MYSYCWFLLPPQNHTLHNVEINVLHGAVIQVMPRTSQTVLDRPVTTSITL
jgi:hypothetical protein